jgi:hypothetical protein
MLCFVCHLCFQTYIAENIYDIICIFQGMKDIAKDKNKQKTAEEVKAESLK